MPEDKKRRLIRVALDGERSWGEHVEKNIYRSLNDCFDNIEVRYPPEHKFFPHNGEKKRLVWGDLFEGVVEDQKSPGVVRPLFIFGEDLTPLEDDDKGERP